MAVLVETPITVDKVAGEQGALVGPAGGQLYFCTTECDAGCQIGSGPGGISGPSGSRVSNSVDL